MSKDELLKVAEARRRFESGEARVLRLAAGLSFSEAASAAGISSTSLWRYESGKTTPRLAQALAYGRFLDRLKRELGR